jgi:hypothetical protein
MTILEQLKQIAAYVAAEDFHAVCMKLGRFASTEAERLRGSQEPVALLHAHHESGLTLFYISTERFIPRKHGTWCVVAPLQNPVEVQSWTEFIPPADFTGDLVSYSFPDVRYRCEVGEAVFVPQGQLFSVVDDTHVEVLLLFGEHPNLSWPESRFYFGTQHAERTLRYPDTPIAMSRS